MAMERAMTAITKSNNNQLNAAAKETVVAATATDTAMATTTIKTTIN